MMHFAWLMTALMRAPRCPMTCGSTSCASHAVASDTTRVTCHCPASSGACALLLLLLVVTGAAAVRLSPLAYALAAGLALALLEAPTRRRSGFLRFD